MVVANTPKQWWWFFIVLFSGVFVAITIPFALVHVNDGFPLYEYYRSSASSFDNFVLQFQRTQQWLLQLQEVELFQTISNLIEDSWWMEFAWQYYQIWQSSLFTAIRDGATAIASVCIFSYYTIQPMVYLSYWILVRFVLIRGLYQFVLLRGICSPHAVSQMKRLVRRFVSWQRSLTPRQILLEISAVTGIVLTIQLLKFLKRRNYLRRVRIYVNKKRTKVSQVRVCM